MQANSFNFKKALIIDNYIESNNSENIINNIKHNLAGVDIKILSNNIIPINDYSKSNNTLSNKIKNIFKCLNNLSNSNQLSTR